MSTFSIKINEEDIKKVTKSFSLLSKSPERVFVRALNKTLTGVKTDLSAEIRTVINATKSGVDKTIKLNRASVDYTSMNASITCTGGPIALRDFIGTRQTKQGVSVQVRKDKSRKIVPGAFIATMKSGHKGVFWRVDKNYKMPLKTELVKKPRNPRGKIMVQRLQIVELCAPRIPDYLGDKGPAMKKSLAKAGERLHKNLEHETDYELSKL